MRIGKKNSPLQKSAGDHIFDVFTYSLLGLIALIILYPLYFVLVASFTTPRVVNSGVMLLYPIEFFPGGYVKTFNYPPIWRGYVNTIVYTGLGTITAIAVTIAGAYPLSRRDMAGRRWLMFLFTFTMFFGGGMIPAYLLMRTLKIYDTLWVMILPGAVSVYNLIVCRTFFESTLPPELYEAATLDGCNDFGFFFRIAVPLSSTIIAVMALFYASGKWNSYFDALIYLMDDRKMPLQIVLRNLLLIGKNATDMVGDAKSIAERRNMADQLKYCVIVVSAAPLLIIYPFLQKYFAKGVMVGAVKG
jgi:putative aldouronate transport system permease protein